MATERNRETPKKSADAADQGETATNDPAVSHRHRGARGVCQDITQVQVAIAHASESCRTIPSLCCAPIRT